MKLKMIKDFNIITNFIYLQIFYVYLSLFSRNDGTKLNWTKLTLTQTRKNDKKHWNILRW